MYQIQFTKIKEFGSRGASVNGGRNKRKGNKIKVRLRLVYIILDEVLDTL